jgi:hypothetical protein
MAPRLAWAEFGFVTLCFVSGLLLSVLNATGANPLFAALLSFAVVGVVIASRRPENPIGFVLLAIGAAWQFEFLADGYARYALETDPGSPPWPELVLAVTSWWFVPAVGLMGTFLLLLFPDGRLPSPRWRMWAWFSATTMVITSVATIITVFRFLGLQPRPSNVTSAGLWPNCSGVL